jgi:hypothetical protein
MSRLPSPLLVAALCAVLAAPAAAQPAATPDFSLTAFVRDATTFTALPWQREALGLSAEQAVALQGIASAGLPTIQELAAEIRMLFEHVGMLDRPVDAREAFALFYDLAAHKAEALTALHAGAEAMWGVLTPEQHAAWERTLEASARAQGPPVWEDAAPCAPPRTHTP